MEKLKKDGLFATKLAAVFCLMANSVVATVGATPLTDHIWVPHVVDMQIEGRAYSDTGKPFLVAGSNAVVTLTLDEFKPGHEWQAYCTNICRSTMDEEYSGKFRHRLKRIEITGHAEGSPSGYLRESFPYYSGCVSYGAGGRTGGRNFLFSGDFTSSARHDMRFVYNVSESAEGSETYRIDNVHFEQCSNSIPSCIAQELLKPIGENGVVRLPLVLPKGPGYHGKYCWTATLVYEEEGTQAHRWRDKLGDGEWREDAQKTFAFGPYDSTGYANMGNTGDAVGCAALLLVTNATGWVFFDKYGQDDSGTPNWFTYWREDGACPGLEKYKDKIELFDEAGYGRCFPANGTVKLSRWVRFTNGVDLVGSAAFHYPEGIEVTNKNHSSMRYSFGGSGIYGIYTVEEVLAHEFYHKRLHDIYAGKYIKGNVLGWLKGRGDSDRKDETYKWFVDVAFAGGGGICALREHEWCDKLCDFEEDDCFREFALSKKDTDTYNLKNKNDEYGAYGDNEFLCMIEANKATKRTVEKGGANPLKDWSFPGAQTYVPRLPRATGADRNASASAKQTKETSPSQPSLAVGGMTKSVDAAADGSVSAIRYRMDVESAGLSELLMHATLVGREGTPAASAYASAPRGSSVAEFRFDGKEVYRSGLEGPFRLGSVVVSEFDGNDVYERATLREFNDAEVEVRRSELSRDDACILDVAEETVSTNGIVLAINIDVGRAGEYAVWAMLTTTGGASVASARAICECTPGSNRVDVVFAAGEIRKSGMDGPYKIDGISLFRNGERIDSRLNLHVLRKVYRAKAFNFEETDDFDSAEFMEQFEEYAQPEHAPTEYFWVMFHPNGGTTAEAIREVRAGDRIGTLPVPVLEGDEFLGWYTDHEGGERVSEWSVADGNALYCARWRVRDGIKNAWTVAFDACGGHIEPASIIVTDGSSVGALPVPTRNEYVFVGWFSEAVGGLGIAATDKVSSDVVYYAHWETIDPEWTVENGVLKSVNLHGAREVAIPKEVTSINGMVFYNCKELEKVIVPPGVAKIGNYAFYGCSSLSIAFVPESLRGAVTVNNQFMNCAADFQLIFYSESIDDIEFLEVKFDATGGSVSPSVMRVVKGQSVGLLPKPLMPDCNFLGWFTAANGGTQVSASTVVNSNVTYYAHWTASSYKLTLKPSSTKHGTVSGGGTYKFGAKATIKAKAKSGYVFAGWFADKACKKPLNPKDYDNRKPTVKYTMPAKNTTVYAKFVTKAAAKKSLKFSSATKKLAKTAKKATAGKAFSLALGISSASLPTVTAKGLPKGLKIDKTTGKITGVGTVPGSYTATITVTDAAGNKITQKVKITVEAAAFAKGAFYGTALPDGKTSSYLRFSVGKTGKVTGKVKHGSKWHSFSSSLASCTASKATFSPKVKVGSKTFTPGTVTVNTRKVGGLSLVEAANSKGTFAAQKTPNLVKKGRPLAALIGWAETFDRTAQNSGLTKKKDSLTVRLESGDAVTVSGVVGGKKLAAISWVSLVSGVESADGGTVYTLYVDIIDAALNYGRTLVITATAGTGETTATAAFVE